MNFHSGLKIGAAILGWVIFGYFSGAFAAHYRWYPYAAWIEPGFRAVEARLERRRSTSGPAVKTQKWHEVSHDKSGVSRDRASASFDGYTFYTTGHKSGAILVDMAGNTVHEWSKSFREVWSNPPHVASPVPESNISWRRARLFRDGSVIAMFTGAGDSPWGYGMIKLDRHSKIVWQYAEQTHHDLDVGPDGRIYTLAHRFDSAHPDLAEKYRHVGTTFLEDFVIVLGPDGREQKRISILDALRNSEHEALLAGPFRGHKWDPFHTNSVNYIGEKFARHHDFAEAGQLFISFRVLDALAILDPEKERIVWTRRGAWKGQHDPDLLENGNVMLFDNLGDARRQGRSRVLEIDPSDGSIVWEYGGSRDDPLYSHLRGSQFPLPNENVLITESHKGRILEVTRNGEVVWEYYNPIRERKDGTSYIPVVTWAQRYPAAYVAAFVDEPGDRK